MAHAPVDSRSGLSEHLILLAAPPASESDGIHDYTQHLLKSLRDRGDIRVSMEDPRALSRERLADIVAAHPGPADVTLLLQYNPFNFGRWGFAPWLPATLWRLRRSNHRPTMALMAHERYVPVKDWRSALMGAWQRAQFFAVRILSDVIFISITPWASELRRRRPRRPVYHLPVASNLPDMRHTRASERERVGADAGTVVLATFGTDHPSRLPGYVAVAAEAVASMGMKTVLLNLGAGAAPVAAGASVEVISPGRLEEQEIARYLAAADVYLAPFLDGVSTRRTTVMAALQHGLPVVGTEGPLTDEIFREAVVLTAVGDPEQFGRAACLVALDRAHRADLARRSRALYESEFDWRVVSSRLVTTLRGAEPRKPAGTRIAFRRGIHAHEVTGDPSSVALRVRARD